MIGHPDANPITETIPHFGLNAVSPGGPRAEPGRGVEIVGADLKPAPAPASLR